MRNLVPALMLLAMLASCAPNRSDTTDGNSPAPTTSSSDTVTVTGVVTEKDDKVPADGGVTLRVRSDAGDDVTIEFESLFTLPAPAAERQELYQKLVPIQAGDRVRVTATRREERLRLENIEKVGA